VRSASGLPAHPAWWRLRGWSRRSLQRRWSREPGSSTSSSSRGRHPETTSHSLP
jgi:hypothetical protein